MFAPITSPDQRQREDCIVDCAVLQPCPTLAENEENRASDQQQQGRKEQYIVHPVNPANQEPVSLSEGGPAPEVDPTLTGETGTQFDHRDGEGEKENQHRQHPEQQAGWSHLRRRGKPL
jgi:hypothetical protein